MPDLPWALHALARLLTRFPQLVNPCAIHHRSIRYPSLERLCLQLGNGELHALAAWTIALGADSATVARYGEPDDDGVIRSGRVHLHVVGEAPTGRLSRPTIPVEVWCAVPQLDAGDLADGATLTRIDAMLNPLALAR